MIDENSLFAVQKSANKYIYCVLREHLFQFKANKTMAEIFPFCTPGPPLATSPASVHTYFDKMSGCIHKNRMYVSFTCAECHELSCKFYDKMSKMCMVDGTLLTYIFVGYYTVGSWTISNPVHAVQGASTVHASQRCNSIAETLIVLNSLAMYAVCVFLTLTVLTIKKS